MQPSTLWLELGAVPVDGEVIQGSSTVTIEHLTGEAKPLERKVGDTIPRGARNLEGMLIVKATKKWKDSTLSKIMQLTEEGQLNKPTLQRWLDEFGEHYSKVVVALSLAVALIGPFIFKWPFIGNSVSRGSIYRALGLMVAASPCALAVAPLAYAIAISSCATPPSPPPPGLGKFNQYLLAITWPVSFCLEKKCSTVKLPRSFTIHGLWPQGRKLAKSMELFDPRQIASLRTALEMSWINASVFPSSVAAEKFWHHEWDGHGRASGLTQQVYFQTTLALFEVVEKLYMTFEKSYAGGIVINITKFAEEFQSLAKPLVICESGRLLELRFKVEKTNQLRFIPSTKSKADVCDGNESVLLPY